MEPLPLAELGLWGRFDVDDFDELVVARVTEAELGRRLPEWRIHRYAPVGYPHPITLDGTPASALGRWSDERLADLAAALDFVVVAGASVLDLDDARAAAVYDLPPEQAAEVLPSWFFVEGLGADLEAATPVAWSAVRLKATPSDEEGVRLGAALRHRSYVSVADDASRAALEACGVDTAIHVVGDPALLAADVIPAPVLARRLAYLRGIAALPAEGDGPAIVVEDHPALVPLAPMISRAVDEVAAHAAVSPVLAVAHLAGPRSGDLTAALTATSNRTVIRLPRETVLEDLCAALASSFGFVGVSPTCAAAAAGFGRPYGLIAAQRDLPAAETPTGEPRRLVYGDQPDSPGDLAAALIEPPPGKALDTATAAIGDHFDRLASLATEVTRRPSPAATEDGELDRQLLERALAARGRQLVAERLAFADQSRDFDAMIASYRRHIDGLNGMLGDLDQTAKALEQRVTLAEAQARSVRKQISFRVASRLRRTYRELRGSS
ncbi:MAG TPA: hypothetical protein VGU73_08765 [Acidimicrobiia bacterium]|nr:hypothetical protein [Acidimicrobiia bacterium]